MIGEAAVNIVLNILLCRVLGIFGIILATVISVFITNFFFCPKILFRFYFKNGKLKEYWKDHLYYAMTMLLTVGISWGVCERLLPVTMAGKDVLNSVICLSGRLGICSLLSVGIFAAIWRRSRMYCEAAAWIRHVLKISAK